MLHYPDNRQSRPAIVAFTPLFHRLPALQTQLCCNRQHPPSRHPQIRQREQRHQLRGVLRQSLEVHHRAANCSFTTWDGCSTFARIDAFRYSSHSVASLYLPSGNTFTSPRFSAKYHRRTVAHREIRCIRNDKGAEAPLSCNLQRWKRPYMVGCTTIFAATIRDRILRGISTAAVWPPFGTKKKSPLSWPANWIGE